MRHNLSIRTRTAKFLFAFLVSILSWQYTPQAAQVLPNRVPGAVNRLHLRASGQLPNATPINLVIGLPWRNREALTNLLQDLYNPASPNFHHYLTPKQFADEFGPSTNDYETLTVYVQGQGFTVTHRHPNRMLLDVRGPASAVETMLHVHLLTYRHPTESRNFYAPDAAPSLDSPVPVLDINGLDNYSTPSSYVHSDTNFPSGADGPIPYGGSGPLGYYSGYDFRDAYFPHVTLTGAGQTVGLFEMDGYYTNDVINYEQQAGLPNVPLQNVYLDSITANVPGPNNLEVSLDIDLAIAMAPGLTSIIIYHGTNSADILNRMATDDLAKQLSSSWKPFDASALTDQALQELMAQGQSMFQASGDSGAQPSLDISQPSSPYETLVGGTTLTTTGPKGSWVSDSVWNPSAGSASGGGISTVYPIPDWQTNVSMAGNQGSSSYRNSPDVSLVANMVNVIANNGLGFRAFGTSCAAPLWAGITALINQKAAQNGLPPVGFLNPALYGIGLSSYYHSCFHDVTVGNSFTPTSPTEFSAAPGYDLCTGWGSPNGESLIDALMPTLTIASSANQIVISWPVIWTNAVLQQSWNLSPVQWNAVTNAISVVKDVNQVIVTPATGTNDFFRLALP
ncbi:MAG TPA: S53 family serine peptidase [Verrucomicrobiae bacterium]|jgi:subtilase family serine protease|nr:S53 family serine peptidase [Verrucomicrobiae bacterium]